MTAVLSTQRFSLSEFFEVKANKQTNVASYLTSVHHELTLVWARES